MEQETKKRIRRKTRKGRHEAMKGRQMRKTDEENKEKRKNEKRE